MQLSNKARQLIKSQCAVILAAQDKTGMSGRWPMPVLKSTVEASIFSEPVLAKNFYDWVKRLKKRGYSLVEISRCFPYASPLARLMMAWRSREIWSLTAIEKIEMMNWLAEILSPFYQKDPFALSGQNILWTEEKIKNQVFFPNKAIRSELMAKLDGKLWMYTEMLFSRWHNLAHEFHGPYEVGREKLLVKEWHDLRGWEQKIFSRFPYKKIVCYEFYRHNKVRIDLHNRLLCKRPLVASLTRCFVEVDGRLLNNTQIRDIIKRMDGFILSGAKYLAGLDRTELKLANAYVEFYALKPLAAELGKNWQPPLVLLNKIKFGRLGPKEKDLLTVLKRHYQRMNRQTISVEFNPGIRFH